MAEGEVSARNPAIAGVLSFLVPGLGQVYNGQPRLGAALAVATYGSALLAGLKTVGALSAPDPQPLVSGAVVWVGVATLCWLGGVALAVVAALDRPQHVLQPFNHVAVYVGGLALFLVVGPLLLSRPILLWMLARNGIRTPAETEAWLARVRRVRAGAAETLAQAQARRDSQLQAHLPVPDLELRIPRDTAELSRNAATVIHLVLVGGVDGGVYDVFTVEPTCTVISGDLPSWANLFTNPVDSTGITAVQLQIRAEAGTTRSFQLSVNVGNLPRGRSYVVDGTRYEPGVVPPSATVERRGSGAVLRAMGTTPEGVRIEATVQCRSVRPG